MRGDNNAPRFLFCCCCGKLRCPGWVNKNRPGGKKGSSEFRNRSREHEKGDVTSSMVSLLMSCIPWMVG